MKEPGSLRFIIFLLGIILSVHLDLASQSRVGVEKVKILRSDKLEMIQDESGQMRRLVGNVALSHNGALMYCDSAVQKVSSNLIEAYGHIRILQGDTISLTGDTLTYHGNSRVATVTGKPSVFRDQNRTLTSNRLEYDMAQEIASYALPGRTIDQVDTLTSKTGRYYTTTKQYSYYGKVKLVNDRYILKTDTLYFNSLTNWATFNGPTEILNEDGKIIGSKGRHNTKTGLSIFEERTTVNDEAYILTGDSLAFDEPNEEGYAQGNVEIVAKKDSTILLGDEGFYKGKDGLAKSYGHALVKTVMTSDTLYIRADTLYSIQSKKDSSKTLIGDKNVFLFKSDFQGKCDSISFQSVDSVIRFYKDPILWSGYYQLKADSIATFLLNHRLDKIALRRNSFVIAQDSILGQFNQVKGRTIDSYFNRTTKLKKVEVDGNGESAYYVLDEDQKLVGLNRVLCGKMNIFFNDNQISKIAFNGRPDGRLVPPTKITEALRHLEGFNWRIDEKPTLEVVTWKVAPKRPRPKQPKEESLKNFRARAQ